MVSGGLVVGSSGPVAPIDDGEPQPPPRSPSGGDEKIPPPQTTVGLSANPTPQQSVAVEAQPAGTSGLRKGAIGFSLMSGLFPLPFNPLFIPIQMTAFIIILIILLTKGWGFWNAALLAWLIPGLIAAVIHYTLFSTVLSIAGLGEDEY